MGWGVSASEFILAVMYTMTHIGMGTFHAWEKYGDGAVPDIQAVAKGLGGGYEMFSTLCTGDISLGFLVW